MSGPGAADRHEWLLLACGGLAAVCWALGSVALRGGPLGVVHPSSDPAAFGAWAGSPAVRLATLLDVLSRGLQIPFAFGVFLALRAGAAARAALTAALLLTFGHLAAAATAGVPLFVYPRVADLIAEGRVEAVDIVAVMPMAAVVARILPVVIGSLLLGWVVWQQRELPRASGWMVAGGSMLSLVQAQISRSSLWIPLLFAVWASGAVWMTLRAAARPGPSSPEASGDDGEGATVDADVLPVDGVGAGRREE